MQLGLPAKVKNSVTVLGYPATAVHLHTKGNERIGGGIERGQTLAAGRFVGAAQARQNVTLDKLVEVFLGFTGRLIVKEREEQPFVVSDCYPLCKNGEHAANAVAAAIRPVGSVFERE
jgi:hypothetical protein